MIHLHLNHCVWFWAKLYKMDIKLLGSCVDSEGPRGQDR